MAAATLTAVISYDIPHPRPYTFKNYPWQTVEIGGSFAFAKHLKPNTAWTYTSQANKFYAPKRFQCLKHNGEMRCWRVA